MAGIDVARHRYDMMWLSRHGVVGTASRQVPNVCMLLCMLVGPCLAVPTWLEEYSHISAILFRNCLQLPGHYTGRHDRSRQLQFICTKCVHKMPGLVRPYWPSRQVITTCRDRPCHRLTKVSVPAMSCHYYVVPCRGLSLHVCHE